MVQLYGWSGADRNLLRECSPRIKDFEDIKPTLTNLKNEFEKDKKKFFDKLPQLVDDEKGTLEELNKREEEIEESWNIRIKEAKNDINENKWKIWKYFDLLYKEKILKPREIRIAQNNISEQEKIIHKLENNPDEVYAKEQDELISEINQLERAFNSPDYSGAYGELKTLKELKKLSDDYYVFCDLELSLKDYVRYHGIRNLRSAQMDFTVVGPTGIFLIEVKNWSNEYLRNNRGISPHEQVDRANLVLWIYLKNHSFFYKPKITKVIVPIQHNIKYNPNYKSVLIKDVANLKQFIENKDRNNLSESRIRKIVSILK
jgi:hypothetical protein